MKRIPVIIIVIMMISALLLSVGCHANVPTAEGTATLMIQEGEEMASYVVELSELADNKAVTLIEYLAEHEELHIVMLDGAYGKYITEIGALVASESAFISPFTTNTKEMDVSTYAQTILIPDTDISVTTSGLGISNMTLEDGGVIYIKLATIL